MNTDKTWLKQCEEQYVKDRQAEYEYWFGLTHYDWMYRATGDKKYLEEQKEYIKKHGDGSKTSDKME
jgi:hypothetical protein